jgi:hypothetical protein
MEQDNEKQLAAYHDAVNQIKTAILQSQLRAAKLVNSELLSLYFAIGKFISEHSRNEAWGKSSIDVISRDLQKALPGLRGFSPTYLRKMRMFYKQWQNLTFRSPTANEIQNAAT